jgi:hypothetical protein
MVKTTYSPSTTLMDKHFTTLKDQNFHCYNIIMYKQMFKKHLIRTSQLENKLKILEKNIFSSWLSFYM